MEESVSGSNTSTSLYSFPLEEDDPDSFEKKSQETLSKATKYLLRVQDYIAYQYKKLVEGREDLKGERAFVARLKEELNISQHQLAHEREQFEREKELVAQKNIDTADLLRLNVGGTEMTAMRRTLTSVKGSMLETMFSGRHNLQKDELGRYFINRNPELFKKVLSFLRDGELKLPSFESKGPVTRKAVLTEFDYFCIPVEKELQSKEAIRFLKQRPIVEYKTLDCDDWLWCLDVHQNRILSGSRNNSISIWSMETGECVSVLKGHRNAVKCLEVCEDFLVSGSEDRTIKIWDLTKMKNIRSLIAHTDVISCLKVVGSTIFSASFDSTIKIWDMNQESSLPQSTLSSHTGNILCIDTQGARIFSGAYDNLVKVWDTTTGRCIQSLDGHSNYVRCVKANDNMLISGSYDKTIKLWDMRTWECISTLTNHEDYIRCIEVIGNVLVSGSNDKTIRIWDLRDYKCKHTLTGHHDFVTCLKVVGPTIISGSLDRTIKIWTGEEMKTSTLSSPLKLRSHSLLLTPRKSKKQGEKSERKEQ